MTPIMKIRRGRPMGRGLPSFRSPAGKNRIAVMNIDGSNVEVLTPPEQNTIHPNWSSDSKQIIYCTTDDLKPPAKNTAEIYSIEIATKKVTPLITGGINTYGSLSPHMRPIV